ncbi:uncharacterized protein LOC111106484 [Crassostrea virginica]
MACASAGLFSLLICCCLQVTHGSDYCYYRYYYRKYYCYYDTYMEDDSVAGLVVGLIILAVVIAVVVCILKAKYNRSRVVSFSGNAGTTAVQVNNVNTFNHAPPPPHPGHGFGPQQPGYGGPQPGYGYPPPNQPMYGGGNPAYPPGQIY